jgi:hypothetical protein
VEGRRAHFEDKLNREDVYTPTEAVRTKPWFKGDKNLNQNQNDWRPEKKGKWKDDKWKKKRW